MLAETEDFSHGITQEIAGQLLKKDIAMTGAGRLPLVKPALNQPQFDALVSLVYNIGVPAFSKSSLLKFLNLMDFKAAAEQFRRWCYTGGKKIPGLSRRREAERAVFLTSI